MKFAAKVLVFDEFDCSIFVYVSQANFVPCQRNSDLIATLDIGRGKRYESDADPRQILNQYFAPFLVLGKLGIISLNVGILALSSSRFKEDLKRRPARALHFQFPRIS
jgi:hypothetical protein